MCRCLFKGSWAQQKEPQATGLLNDGVTKLSHQMYFSALVMDSQGPYQ